MPIRRRRITIDVATRAATIASAATVPTGDPASTGVLLPGAFKAISSPSAPVTVPSVEDREPSDAPPVELVPSVGTAVGGTDPVAAVDESDADEPSAVDPSAAAMVVAGATDGASGAGVGPAPGMEDGVGGVVARGRDGAGLCGVVGGGSVGRDVGGAGGGIRGGGESCPSAVCENDQPSTEPATGVRRPPWLL